MRKHYAFIPLSDQDICGLRKTLLKRQFPRPVFALFCLGILGYLGFFYRFLLEENSSCFIVFSFCCAVILYFFLMECQKLFLTATLRKRSLLPFIKVRGLEHAFFIEEVTDGFIVQVAPLNENSRREGVQLLETLTLQIPEETRLLEYLRELIASSDDRLRNKGIIYVEVILDQLKKGNRDILATYDRILHYKN